MWIKNPDTGKRKRLKRDKKEWSVRNMQELRIIPQELWDNVQERLLDIRSRSGNLRAALNNPKTRAHSGKYLFSGLLQCGCCGASYTICSTTSYGCTTNLNRGDAACPNRLRVPKKLIEGKLLDVVRQELLSEAAVNLFIEEITSCLRLENQKPKTDLDIHNKDLKRIEKEINNLMAAIKMGIITPSTKSELERAEAERTRSQAALDAVSGAETVFATTLPNAAEYYRKLVQDLGRILQTDIAYARQCLKTLLGCIKLVPSTSGTHLEAELRHNPEGLFRMALKSNCHELKVRMVAGVGFELNI